MSNDDRKGSYLYREVASVVSSRHSSSEIDKRGRRESERERGNEKEGRALTRARYDSRRERYETRPRERKRKIIVQECDSGRGGLEAM